jgi:hypothetical protein
MVESYRARCHRPAGCLRFSGGIRAGDAAVQADDGHSSQVPSGAARVRRTMNRYGKCTGGPAQAVTDFVPPSDPALKGEGVQHKPEREQAAQDQSE